MKDLLPRDRKKATLSSQACRRKAETHDIRACLPAFFPAARTGETRCPTRLRPAAPWISRLNRSPFAPCAPTSQLPTGPIRRVEELIRLFGISKSHACRVPLQLRACHPDRNHAQQGDLCKRPAVGSKIGAGPGAIADRLQPIPMVFLDSRNGLLRTFVFVLFFLRYDSDAACPVRTVDYRALFSRPPRAGLDILVVFFHVLRARNSFRAAVPMQRDRTALAFGGKLVGDNFALGKGVTLRLRVV